MRFLQLCPDSGKLQNDGTTLLGRAFRPRVRARLARFCDGQVPYGSLASVMARNVHDHAEFASVRQTGLVAAQLIVGVVFVPMIVLFSGAGVMTQKGYTLAALVRRFGKKPTCVGCFFVGEVADILNFLLPANIVTFIVLVTVGYVSLSIPNGICRNFMSDVIDCGYWHTGKRHDGITYAAYNFSRKFALSLAGVMASGILALTGYAANQAQGAGTLLGVKGAMTLCPGVTLVVRCSSCSLPTTSLRIASIASRTTSHTCDGSMGFLTRTSPTWRAVPRRRDRRGDMQLRRGRMTRRGMRFRRKCDKSSGRVSRPIRYAVPVEGARPCAGRS